MAPAPRSNRSLVVLAALAVSWVGAPAPALAVSPVATLPRSIVVPAGPGQQTLAVQVDVSGIQVRACAAAPCSADGAPVLAAPEGATPRFGQAVLTPIVLDGGRAIARIDVPSDVPSASWVVLVTAPLAKDPPEARVLWSGWAGLTRGEAGEEHAAEVLVERARGGARVLVGERRADVTICGRPTLVGARVVDPATLTLARGASVQNLSEDERAKATRVAAVRAKDAAPAALAQVLRATAASSAYEKRLAALTDGDAATAWSENRAGDGRGEFVTMSAPDEVGITALDVVVRPTGDPDDVPDGVAPKRFYLATPDALVEVVMPEDAWQRPPGTRYTVSLPAELHTSCLAVALEEAFATGRPDARVSIAEITARTAFDGMAPEALAGALAGGSARSRAAAALLARSGPRGVGAAIAAYDKLDDAGRELARVVVDTAPCADQVPFFAARFGALTAAAATRAAAPAPGALPSARPAPGEIDPELAHARDRLRRCGRASAPALVDLVTKGAPRTRLYAADELAALAPAEAVPALLDALTDVALHAADAAKPADAANPADAAKLASAASADEATRRELRASLARAARNPRAAEAVRAALAPEKLSARTVLVAVDLLRAVGPALGAVGGGAAFADVSARAADARARYLLQGPAAELAFAGDAGASGYLRRSLREDTDPHVRARAAELAARVPDLLAAVQQALDDAEPRVREAAVTALTDAAAHGAEAHVAAGAAPLRNRLAVDDWTFVRAGAAHALAALPADATTDTAFAKALRDAAPDVRSAALDGLGAHRAVAHLEAVRARQNDGYEVLEVRARAVLALGAMCDARSASDWTTLARAAKNPADERDRRLGGAAIAALGDLHPADLAERLGPLLEKDAPPGAREMAKAALAGKGACR